MHILIIGAGYAGLRAALDLSKRVAGREDLAQITLVDRNLYHQHIIMLHLAATESVNLSEVALPLDTILRRRAVRFHQGTVVGLDPGKREVLLHDGLALHYDRLVLALGGQTNFGSVPGAAEYSWSLRSYDEALRLRDHVQACFQKAAQTTDQAARRALLTFAIVGGGFTGVQLAGELADWARILCSQHDIAPREVRVALLERSHLLLGQFGEWATSESQRVLSRRGVSIHLNMSVERVEERKLVVGDTQVLHSATIVWAGGVRAPRLLEEAGLTTDERGRIVVDRYLRGTGPEQSSIFAAGDCAQIPNPWGGVMPGTASHALRQGEHLGEALWYETNGTAPPAYLPMRLGSIVSLGPGDAVGDPLGVRTNGLPAALLKQAVERWYLTTLWT